MSRACPTTRTNRPGPRRGAAFTVIELLLVIAIISVLIGITLPALSISREHAQRVQCQGMIGGLNTALSTYAADYKSFLPPGPVERTAWGAPHELYRQNPDPRLHSRAGWFGLGQTWRGGYVENGKVFYCPAADRNGGVSYEQAWPEALDASRDPADGKTKIYGSYAYRGGQPDQANSLLRPVDISRAAGDTPLLADNPCSNLMWHQGGYNVVFLGGHVRFARFSRPMVPDGQLPLFWQALKPPTDSYKPEGR